MATRVRPSIVRGVTLDQVLASGQAFCAACQFGPTSLADMEQHRRSPEHAAQAGRWASSHGYPVA